MILSIIATVAVLAAIAVIAAALLFAETTLVYVALGLGAVSALLLVGAVIQGRPGGGGSQRERSGTDGLGKSSVPVPPPAPHGRPEDPGPVPAPAPEPVREATAAPESALRGTRVAEEPGEPEFGPSRPKTPAAATRPEPDTGDSAPEDVRERPPAPTAVPGSGQDAAHTREAAADDEAAPAPSTERDAPSSETPTDASDTSAPSEEEVGATPFSYRIPSLRETVAAAAPAATATDAETARSDTEERAGTRPEPAADTDVTDEAAAPGTGGFDVEEGDADPVPDDTTPKTVPTAADEDADRVG
ncbi:hypothetical protein [Nocardiopsis sp. FIRDI 009]|uniref:hypothetical protein n=1 Tax=Nocardiopsis sp. FIRDI 009 TaxID=714197 RepID=UPI0018E502C8|nr:hypothetical protein [Nocardiopsis sp. FIRDI 009]